MKLPVGASILARPTSAERVLRDNGLLRQASRMTMFTWFAGELHLFQHPIGVDRFDIGVGLFADIGLTGTR